MALFAMLEKECKLSLCKSACEHPDVAGGEISRGWQRGWRSRAKALDVSNTTSMTTSREPRLDFTISRMYHTE